jgi:hypothetical protein
MKSNDQGDASSRGAPLRDIIILSWSRAWNLVLWRLIRRCSCWIRTATPLHAIFLMQLQLFPDLRLDAAIKKGDRLEFGQTYSGSPWHAPYSSLDVRSRFAPVQR